jgi:hypothetical protein
MVKNNDGELMGGRVVEMTACPIMDLKVSG